MEGLIIARADIMILYEAPRKCVLYQLYKILQENIQLGTVPAVQKWNIRRACYCQETRGWYLSNIQNFFYTLPSHKARKWAQKGFWKDLLGASVSILLPLLNLPWDQSWLSDSEEWRLLLHCRQIADTFLSFVLNCKVLEHKLTIVFPNSGG